MEADAAQEEAKYESQSTTIITAEEIAKKQAKSVEDIIFSEVSVTRTVDAMGRVGVPIRGAEPRHTLILVDGQPVMGDFAKYYGAADELQRLGTENVERIEIIRGAASAKYGADAIGGVINVVTKQPAKTAGLQFNVEGRRERGDSDVFPYANAFLRADSGRMGKLRLSAWGTKRDLMPIVRFDHSSLFGSHVTANLGMTHNVRGNAHRRLKANIGTGYAEPGMGELYYNWEMYGGNPMGYGMLADDPNAYGGIARLGWYWQGNPDLKPEKSVNIDLSIEGENRNTYAKAGIFYNRIRNYMTTYFTGSIMDFSPELNSSTIKGQDKWQAAPDMIYSFKNIGRAEISGIEAEVEHKMGSRWKAKLGYAFLHAINKSDPNMPRRLLDKPQHKLDIGLTYTDEKHGWQATLWGDYYIRMLDSNSIAGGGNYMYSRPDKDDPTRSKIGYRFADQKNITYEKKTFGLWNLMVQKRLGRDGLVYLGVDNILNHRDDDRAFGGRVYRLGVNLKFDALAPRSRAVRGQDGTMDAGIFPLRDGTARRPLADTVRRQGDFFITKPFDETKSVGTEIIGDHRLRWNAHNGTNRPMTTASAKADISDAERNMLDASEHGFSQRLRVGVDARLTPQTNLTVLAGAAGQTGVDTAHEIGGSHGLNHVRLENADLTQYVKKWDLSLGRLTEPMGVTGYYFAKEYDGARAVWTDGAAQVRVGYGTFRHSTGVSDSAYTRASIETFYRAPTVDEFIGLKRNGDNFAGEEIVPNASDLVNFYQQLKNAATVEEQYAIVRRMLDFAKAAYGEKFIYDLFTQQPGGRESHDAYQPGLPSLSTLSYSYKDAHGVVRHRTIGYVPPEKTESLLTKNEKTSWNDAAPLAGDGSAYRNAWWEKHGGTLSEGLARLAQSKLGTGETFQGFDSDLKAEFMKQNDTRKQGYGITTDGGGSVIPNAQRAKVPVPVSRYFDKIVNALRAETEDGSRLPRKGLESVLGKVIPVTGTVLRRDTIPPIDKALFIQTKYEVTPDLGIAAWYLKSVSDRSRTYAAAHGTGNDLASFDNLASVIGVGAKLRLGRNAAVSLDYGQNRTAFGRYMNGGTVYDHTRGNSDFKMLGRAAGGIPSFYVLRFDIGESDTDRPGSWNAFVAYKRFDHGSFFGGNGTESLPDRYLDGIASFTIGGGYVPMPNLLVEAFDTFDAKGVNKRDTLYGAENFKLGNYTRVQVTYKF